jgi:hypothetical protein
MSNPLDVGANRRQFLTGVGGVVAAGAAGTGAASDDGGAQTLAAARSASVVLHDPRIPMSAAVAESLRANGAQLITLDGDPVRLWRSEVGRLLAQPGTRLFGLTRWADYLIVKGLAAETRRHTRHEQLHADSGHFTWLIA